ncbi:MAG: hypothetical protein ABJO36_01740 [Litorimonas sp.]
MKLFVAALAVSFGLSGCATAPSGTSSEHRAAFAESDNSPLVNELYSDDEIMAIMFGGGERDPDKFAARLERTQSFPLGSEGNPVRAHMPQGQVSYLSRLKCESGARPGFERAGSFGAGPYETILDGYNLTCSGVAKAEMVFMDMYHPGYIETVAIPGFTID